MIGRTNVVGNGEGGSGGVNPQIIERTITEITADDLKGVNSIGNYVFYNYNNATRINIPESVTSIGIYAFYGCGSLTSITIPEGVASIDNYAFQYCRVLTEINYNATACEDLSANNYVFSYAGQNETGITVNIGANVTKIPNYLFNPNNSTSGIKITNIIFEENSKCENIGAYSFGYCSALTNIVIPNSVTTIENYAFSQCTNLTSITIGEGVTSIGNYAFNNCTNLTGINYNVTACADLSQRNYIFYNAGKNGNGITVNIGANVTKIPACLFNPSNSSSYSPKITSVVFEAGSVCASIGAYAFQYCSSLTSITIPNSMTSIGNSAFWYCSSLTSITIPSSVTSIGSSVFSYCSSLTEFNIYNDFNINLSDIGLSGRPLTYETLIDMINKVKDRTGETIQYTFNVGATNLAKLSDSEKAILTSKNWLYS